MNSTDHVCILSRKHDGTHWFSFFPVVIMIYNGKILATMGPKKPHRQSRDFGNIYELGLLMDGVQVADFCPNFLQPVLEF